MTRCDGLVVKVTVKHKPICVIMQFEIATDATFNAKSPWLALIFEII